jgi:hypothetical protein
MEYFNFLSEYFFIKVLKLQVRNIWTEIVRKKLQEKLQDRNC